MKLYIKIIGACVLAVSLAGCLKDDSTVLDPNDTQNVIEFANTANLTSPTTSKYPLLSINILMDPAGTTYNAVVSYSGAHNAPQDITVEVGVADSIVAKYNTQNAKAYVVLPANLYTLPTTTVVIPRGARQVNFPITFVNPTLLFNKNYALALTIKSASYGAISGNFGTMLYLLSGINKYDGVYTLKFKFGTNDRGYDLAATTWFYSDVQLVTTGIDSVVLRNLNAATPYPHAAVSNGLPTSISGSAASDKLVPRFKFDLATNNITTVSNSVVGVKTAVPNPAVTTNRADLATKNVFASFILKETGKLDMIINDTLIYKTPR